MPKSFACRTSASPTNGGTAPLGSPTARLIGGNAGVTGSSSVASFANADGGRSERRPGKSMHILQLTFIAILNAIAQRRPTSAGLIWQKNGNENPLRTAKNDGVSSKTKERSATPFRSGGTSLSRAQKYADNTRARSTGCRGNRFGQCSHVPHLTTAKEAGIGIFSA